MRLGDNEGMNIQYRYIRGVAVPAKPSGSRRFERESVRWLCIRDGLQELADHLPRNQYAMHSKLQELYVEALEHYLVTRELDAQLELDLKCR